MNTPRRRAGKAAAVWWGTPKGGTRRVELLGWGILVLVVAGPVVLGLLLHRIGFSRAVTLGLGMVVIGGAILVAREPLVDSSVERHAQTPPNEPTTSTIAARPTVSKSPAPSPSKGDAERLAAALAEVKTLRASLAALQAEQRRASPRPPAAPATSSLNDALEPEHAPARRATDQALQAARERIAAAEGLARTSGEALAREKAERRADREALEAVRLRLAIANAEIARLKTTIRAAEPVATASPLAITPAPFSNTPAPPQSEPQIAAEPAAATTTAIATGTTAPVVAPEPPAAAFGRTLAEAMRSKSFALVKIANGELVEGRKGSYYRVTCPGPDGKPLRFGSGDYSFDKRSDTLDTCFKAVQSLLLKALPTGAHHEIYVQGYASRRGFIKPKRLPSGDGNLRTVDYLPRRKGESRFLASPARLQIGDRYANAELPTLRAAYVSARIARMTGGSLRPTILEGEARSSNDPASQSFALLLRVAW